MAVKPVPYFETLLGDATDLADMPALYQPWVDVTDTVVDGTLSASKLTFFGDLVDALPKSFNVIPSLSVYAALKVEGQVVDIDNIAKWTTFASTVSDFKTASAQSIVALDLELAENDYEAELTNLNTDDFTDCIQALPGSTTYWWYPGYPCSASATPTQKTRRTALFDIAKQELGANLHIIGQGWDEDDSTNDDYAWYAAARSKDALYSGSSDWVPMLYYGTFNSYEYWPVSSGSRPVALFPTLSYATIYSGRTGDANGRSSALALGYRTFTPITRRMTRSMRHR